MTFVIPTQGNVVVKSVEVPLGKLFVDFARTSSRAINRYTQIQPVPKTSGLYTRMTIEEAGRVLYPDGRNFEWFDGSPAPTGADGLESFEMEPFYTKRRAFAIRLGDLTIDMADWKLMEQNMRIKAQQAMTLRTQLAVTALTTSANYANYAGDTSHVMDVTTIAGASGSWADSTTARGDIQRSIETACEQILDDTLNGVNLDDLVLVISSALAAALTRSQEIKDYIKGSPDAFAQVRGELPGGNVHYGLPAKLFGVPVVVEATRKVTNKKGAAPAPFRRFAGGHALHRRPPGQPGVNHHGAELLHLRDLRARGDDRRADPRSHRSADLRPRRGKPRALRRGPGQRRALPERDVKTASRAREREAFPCSLPVPPRQAMKRA